ncbi:MULTISPECIES: hypothetical protein [unclassified Variovorax]|uniref:hypothetical protein n=1 Tax=unclassified Variovorax TaxID=663243 RepID=UPI00131923BD|nr:MULTISPECIES: hypothetical protein [unclassified Variovorax]VTU29327.1 hypothetical protein SRS16CHR_04447 [Variovorax sp. SRS16]VTU36831.1 hypothetical protein E5CHR_04415 [Variovorax sp. PBL-E5]
MSTDTVELVVDEPSAGHFYWILQKHEESCGEAVVIETAEGPMPSYGAAMMAGIAALQRRADARGAGEPSPIVTVFVDPQDGFGAVKGR